MRRDDVGARTGEDWLAWLAGEVDRRGASPEARLLVLWDVLEEWFASEDFDGAFLSVSAPELRGDGDGATRRAVTEQRSSVRHLLEDLAKSAGAHDPVLLASQLQVLYEGAIIGALIDGKPTVARIARRLTMVALLADGDHGIQ